MLRSLRHYLQAQSVGHRAIDGMEEEEGGAERGDAQRPAFKGRESETVRQTNNETVSYATLGTFLHERVGLWGVGGERENGRG